MRRQDVTLTLTRALHGYESNRLDGSRPHNLRVSTVLHGWPLVRRHPSVLDFPMCPPVTWDGWHQSDGIHFPALHSALCSKVAAALADREVRAARAVLAMSTYSQRELRRQWPTAHIDLVLPGVDFPVTRPELRSRRVAFLGAIERQKGVLDLVGALNDLKVESVFAGPQSARSAPLLQAIGDLPRSEYVGYVDPAVRNEYLAQAAVVVIPSHHEGFGLVILEAMALGILVIATRSTGAPDARVEEFGWLVEPGDVLALRNAVAEAVSLSTAERARRGRLAHEIFRSLGFDRASYVARWREFAATV